MTTDAAPSIAIPNGCAACGVDHQEHCWRWHPTVGLHQWIEPTDAQRLTRMRARREARRG